MDPVEGAGYEVFGVGEWESPVLEDAAGRIEFHEYLVVGRVAEVAAGGPSGGRGAANNDLILGGDMDAPWVDDVAPDVDCVSVLIENLDATVVSFTDVDASLGVDGDGVGLAELTGFDAEAAPGFDEVTFGVVVDDAVVSIAVGYKDVAILGERDVGGVFRG